MRLSRRYVKAADPSILACKLGVSVESLRRLEVGFDGRDWTFPMRDASDRIIGILLRGPGGRFHVRGSRVGIFWPNGVDPRSKELLAICEGPTDCAALLDMGFEAIGRPSCAGGVGIIRQWLAQRRRDVIIIADNDPGKVQANGLVRYPGQEGAKRLAEAIENLTNRLRVIVPPDAKDARDWKNGGATRAVLLALISTTGTTT